MFALLTTTVFAAGDLTAVRTSYGMEIDSSILENADGFHFCAVYDENGRMLAIEEIDEDDNVVYCDVNAVRTVRAFALTENSFEPVDVSVSTTLEAPETPIHVHTWDSGTVTTPASCEEEGVMTYNCTASDCNDPLRAAYTEAIAPTGHNWGNWSGINNVSHRRRCTNDRNHTQTADHEAVLREVYYEPTLTSEGYGQFGYEVCGHIYDAAIPMLESKEVWFTYDADQGEYMLNWLPAEELPSNHRYFINGISCYPMQNDYPIQSLYTPLSQLNLNLADIAATTDIVIETGYYDGSGERTTVHTVEGALVVTEGEAAGFTLTGQTDGTYLVGADADLTAMTVNAKLIHDDGETELVTETYDTPYINIYPWDGSTVELSAMICTISDDTESLIISRTPAETVTAFIRPETPADRTVYTAEELQSALTIGGKVTLGTDITADDMAIYGGEPVTLDLNGHTLTLDQLWLHHGKEVTFIGTTEGSAIVGEIHAAAADQLTIGGGSYDSLMVEWINEIKLEDAAFTSADSTAIYASDCSDITMTGCTATSAAYNAMTLNRGDSLSIEDSTLSTTAPYSYMRYEALQTSEVETVRLIDVTASSVSGSAVELSPAPAYGSSGELYTGSSAFVRGGSYTSECTDISAAALQIRDFDTVEVGGVIDPASDPADLQIFSACHGVELDDVSGTISLSDITATAIGEGTGGYNLFYIHNLETGDAVNAIRLTGNGGRAHTFRVEDRTSLTLEQSTFTAPDNSNRAPAAISIERVGTVAIDRTNGSGGYYSLYIFDCADVDLSNMVLRDSSTFALLANNCAAFDVTACQIYGPMRFDDNGTYRFTGGSWLHGSVSAYGNSLEEFVTVNIDSTCIGVDSTSINQYAVINRQNFQP